MNADEARRRGLGAARGILFATFGSLAFWIAIGLIIVLLMSGCTTEPETEPLPRVTITEEAPRTDFEPEVTAEDVVDTQEMLEPGSTQEFCVVVGQALAAGASPQRILRAFSEGYNSIEAPGDGPTAEEVFYELLSRC